MEAQKTAAMAAAMDDEEEPTSRGGSPAPMGKKMAAKQKQQIQMLMTQIETVKTTNIPSAIKKVETKLEDQMIMIKGMVSSKIKKLEKSLPELIGKHGGAVSTGRRSKQDSGRPVSKKDSGLIRISGEVVMG